MSRDLTIQWTLKTIIPSQASRARGGVAVAEAGGEGVAAEAAAHQQLHRGPGAERGENISAEHWFNFPANTRRRTESDRNFQF